MILADLIAERLVQCGIRHVFGVGGANIEDLFAAVQRRRPALRAVLAKHEHAAGTAADAYARLSGGLGVVLTTSGGGAMNLVHSMAEARASRVPILAIVGEPPTDVQGRGAFQDTSGKGGAVDAAAVFRAVSTWCARAETVEEVPRLLEEAIGAAVGGKPGPAVLLIAKDRQRAEVRADGGKAPRVHVTAHGPEPETIHRAAALIGARSVFIIAGDDVARAGAQGELSQLAELLDAKVAVAPDARDAFDNRSRRFVGVAGAMGHPGVARALAGAGVCLLAGTRLPLLARQGIEAILHEKPLVSLGRGLPFVLSPEGLHLEGEVRGCLSALTDALRTFAGAPDRGDLLASTFQVRQPAVESLQSLTGDVAARPDAGALDSRSALAAIERALPVGSVVLVDAGNTGAAATHYLAAPEHGRWLLAMGMAGMGYAFGAAIGAACATGRRCTVLAGDGAFFMQGLDIHTAVEHALPITYIVFNNSAHGMCLVRERLLLGENAGYNAFRRSHIGAGLAAMLPTLPSCDCRTTEELERALRHVSEKEGPSVICVELSDVEVPPFAAFQQGGRTITKVSRGEGR